MDLSTKIKNLKIDPPWMNASGVLSYPQILKRISKYEIGVLVSKSIGIEPREGFMEPIVYHDENVTLNAVGLANPGLEATRKELKETYPFSKPFICSIFGKDENEFVELATGLEDYCDAIELNVSCPNLREGEKYGIVIGKYPNLVKSYTEAVKENVRKPIIVKLTPNVSNIEKIANAAEEGGADAISAINTMAPATKIEIDSGKHVLTNKYGGLSGPAVKPVGVASVRKIYKSVNIPINGIGGIKKAEDVVEYVRAGASVVSIGTALVNKNTKRVGKYFENLKKDLEKILEEMNVSSLEDLVGVENV